MLNILDKAKEIENYIINFRRDLHENPELSGQVLDEVQFSVYIILLKCAEVL